MVKLPAGTFQPTLTCALCGKSTDETCFRLLQTIAVCNPCVDRLIKEELERLSVHLPMFAKGVH